ncbi:MAG: ATP-binding protein [Anaerolineales bacterium]|nr:MAG: ATP-binding protein [Anaerolineales bacterium]
MISRIEALNYRCLRYVNQPLERFQVLVGPNASGKSSFLDVVALLGDFVHDGLDEAILRNPRHPRGRATTVDELIFNQSADRFELAVELRIPQKLRRPGSGNYERVRYEVALGKNEQNGELAIVGETLWLCAAAGGKAPAAHPQLELFPTEPAAPDTLFTAPGRKKTPAGWRKVVNKVPESGNDYFQSETSKWNTLFRIGPRKAALAGLPQDPDRFAVAIWVRDLLIEGVHILALNSIAMRSPSSPSEPRTFRVDGSNLPLVVQDLKRQHSDVCQAWVEHIRTVLPDIQTINVVERPEDRHLYLAVQYADGGEPVPSWLLSDGTLRLLALTLLAYLPEHEGIYLIEEPENGVHPRAIEAVFQSLSSVYDGQVLIATHSPLILGLASREQILCFARNPSGAVDVVNGHDHPRLRDWKGETDLGTLYASGVLG